MFCNKHPSSTNMAIDYRKKKKVRREYRTIIFGYKYRHNMVKCKQIYSAVIFSALFSSIIDEHPIHLNLDGLRKERLAVLWEYAGRKQE